MIHQIDQDALDRAAETAYPKVTLEAYRILRATLERAVEVYMAALPEPVPRIVERPRASASPEVRLAHLKRPPKLGTKAAIALQAVLGEPGGVTALGVSTMVGFNASSRLSELMSGGWVRVGRRIATSKGLMAVYVATDKGLDWDGRGVGS